MTPNGVDFSAVFASVLGSRALCRHVRIENVTTALLQIARRSEETRE